MNVTASPAVTTSLLDPTLWSGQLFGPRGWAEAPQQVDSIEPATGEVLGVAGTADAATVAAMGTAAAAAQVDWAALPFPKRAALELGGNNPLIVLDDADVDAAASAGAWGSFLHQGQICMAAGRHIVHESIVDDYLRALVERAGRLPVGDPNRDQVALGPIINERQAESVQRIVDSTRRAGATTLIGGDRDGLFFPATVFADVTPDMPAWREEIFGPVAPVMSFRTDDEAVTLANDTELGLAAAVQSGSPERAQALAGRLRAGMVHVNDQTVNDEPNSPFPGLGASGNGVSLGGPANAEAFTEWQWLTSRDRATQFPF